MLPGEQPWSSGNSEDSQGMTSWVRILIGGTIFHEILIRIEAFLILKRNET